MHVANEDARIGFSRQDVLLGTYDNSGTDEARRVAVDADGKVITTATLTGDVEIGAVEIKDGASDQRATVNASGEVLVKDGGGLGALTETAPVTDTASSGINGRLQRIAQRLTSILAAMAPATAGTGTPSSVASSASSVTILASNASRKRWSVFNESTAILYLDTTGGTASATSYTTQVAAGGYFEGPLPVNTGLITGIWASANGNARVVEFA